MRTVNCAYPLVHFCASASLFSSSYLMTGGYFSCYFTPCQCILLGASALFTAFSNIVFQCSDFSCLYNPRAPLTFTSFINVIPSFLLLLLSGKSHLATPLRFAFIFRPATHCLSLPLVSGHFLHFHLATHSFEVFHRFLNFKKIFIWQHAVCRFNLF